MDLEDSVYYGAYDAVCCSMGAYDALGLGSSVCEHSLVRASESVRGFH